MSTTVVIGASDDPSKYSWKAVTRLASIGESVVPVGVREGEIQGLKIRTDKPIIANVDTVSLYVSPRNLPSWESYILSLKPKRIIFNPGTEDTGFAERAKNQGIEILEACTLVMVSTGTYA